MLDISLRIIIMELYHKKEIQYEIRTLPTNYLFEGLEVDKDKTSQPERSNVNRVQGSRRSYNIMSQCSLIQLGTRLRLDIYLGTHTNNESRSKKRDTVLNTTLQTSNRRTCLIRRSQPRYVKLHKHRVQT